MAVFTLKTGETVFVDDVDFERVSAIKWRLHSKGYVVAGGGNDPVLLHRFVVNAPKGVIVDHWDRDKLNNFRSNLRCTDCSGNGANSTPSVAEQGTKTSKFKGVSWATREQKWCARITVDYRGRHLGYFDDEDKAAAAYDQAARYYFKDFARINHRSCI